MSAAITRRPTLTRHKWLGAIIVASLAASACGGDDDDSATPATDGDASPAATTVAAASDTTAAGADTTTADTTAHTTADTTADSAPVPTTGDATAPTTGGTAPAGEIDIVEPQPLPEETVVRVNSQLRGDGTTDLWLADQMGEFAKENIVIEFSQLPSTDALGPLAQGDLDVVATGLSAAFMNSVDAGFATKMVFPFYTEQGDNLEGVWVRNELAADAPASLAGAKMGSTSGIGSPVSLAVYQYLQQAGLKWDDIEIVTFPATEIPTALENGAVDFAYILSPFWTQVAEGGYAEFVQGSIPGFQGGGYLFGDTLLNQHREVGEAFIRALIRTRQTYLQGDYKAVPEIAQQIAVALDADEAVVQMTPPVVWSPEPSLDWDQQVSDLQQVWIEAGEILNYQEPIPTEELLDTGFIDAVLQ